MSSSEERGPSAGLLAKVKEALKNPHLVWLGERAPTPRQAAIICQTLGLTNEEEKQTKAVAVLKKNWPDLFKIYVSSASKTDTEAKSRRKEMKVKWGLDHYRSECIARGRKLEKKIEDLLSQALTGTFLCVRRVYNYGQAFSVSDPTICKHSNSYTNICRVCDRMVVQPIPRTDSLANYTFLKKSRNWLPLVIHVYDKAYLNLAKRIARRYEKRSRQSVTIEKEY